MSDAPRDDTDLGRLAGSVRIKVQHFYSDLTPDERQYIEAHSQRAKADPTQAGAVRPMITAPGIGLAINNSSRPLVVTDFVCTGSSGERWNTEDVFDGAVPGVGDVIPVGSTYAFNWIEYFFGSGCDLYLEAQDGSGTIRTRTSMSIITGWQYECDLPTGSLAVGQQWSVEHWAWNMNVEVVDS